MNEPGEGPTVVDLIRRGRCNLVVNTPGGGPEPRSDGYLIREAALVARVPVHHDDRRRHRSGARDRERPRRDRALAAGADRCRDRGESVLASAASSRSGRTRSSGSSAASLAPGVPGQFFMLEAPGCLLPRPLSLCLAPRGELAFLIDPIGPGTTALAELETGERIHVFGPLGNGYRLDVPRPLLVGGGIGIAPLPYLSEALERPPAVLGFRSEHHAEAAALVPNAEVVIDPVLVTDVLPARPRHPGLRPRADARGDPRARPVGPARLGGADGLRLRRLLRLRRRDRRLAEAPLRRGAGPVLLNASGCLDALTAPDVAAALDAFVTKTVTPLPREGNAPPRIAEVDAGMLNSIGLANPGRDRFLADDAARSCARSAFRCGSRSAGSPRPSTRRRAPRLTDVTIELNLSCPNVDEAPEGAAEIVAACRAATSLPLYAKLSPHAWDIGETVRAVEAAGADGISLVNTLRGLALDSQLTPRLATGGGGYSGPVLKPVALAAIYGARRATELPIVGMGGVWNGRDALELIACGATHVALGTVLFADPDAPRRVRDELRAAATRRRLRHVPKTRFARPFHPLPAATTYL